MLCLLAPAPGRFSMIRPSLPGVVGQLASIASEAASIAIDTRKGPEATDEHSPGEGQIARSSPDGSRQPGLPRGKSKNPKNSRNAAIARAKRAIADMYLAVKDEHWKRGRAIEECCKQWAVALTAAGAVPVPVSHCRQRMCPACAVARGERLWKRVERLIASQERPPKLLTVTQQTRKGEPLRKTIDRFNSSWRRLYRTKEWRAHVRGAVACREVTYSKDAWHFHMHIVADMDFWDVREISKLWERVSRGSSIVWINEAKPGTEREAVKYAVKMLSIPTPELLRQATDALRGVRMVSCLGTWRDAIKEGDLEPSDTETDEGRRIVAWWEVIQGWRRREEWAVVAMQQLEQWFRDRAGDKGAMWLLQCIAVARLRFDLPGIGNVFDSVPGGQTLEHKWQREGRLPYRLAEE